MKKTMKLMFLLGVVSLLFCGCTAENENRSSATTGTVTTDGSTSMEKVIGYLSEFYTEENDNVKITYNPTGSGSGIRAVQEGRCDLGLSSRSLTDAEATDLNETVVAIDAITVITNPNNTVTDLTVAQIGAIYRGEITNWKEVGGADSPIVLIGREAASGTRDGFEAVTATEHLCRYTQELTSTGDVIQTVASNPNAIGYASSAAVKDTVKTIAVEGVLPTKETVQNGSYQICRNFFFVTSKHAPLSETAKAFFDFATSAKSDALIEKAGAIPVSH